MRRGSESDGAALPRVLCSRCLLRGDRILLRVGHVCVDDDGCRTCGAMRLRRIAGWDRAQGFVSFLEPCQVCVAKALWEQERACEPEAAQ